MCLVLKNIPWQTNIKEHGSDFFNGTNYTMLSNDYNCVAVPFLSLIISLVFYSFLIITIINNYKLYTFVNSKQIEILSNGDRIMQSEIFRDLIETNEGANEDPTPSTSKIIIKKSLSAFLMRIQNSISKKVL